MNQTIIKNIFEREYNGSKNPMTPNIVKYGKFNNLVYEISKGRGPLTGETIFGITFLELIDNKKNLVKKRRNDLCTCVDSLKAANAYINSLRFSESDPINL